MAHGQHELANETSEQKLDFEAVCVHCRLPLEKVEADNGKDWRHTGSGSIFCKKKRGMTLMEATPRQRPESAKLESTLRVQDASPFEGAAATGGHHDLPDGWIPPKDAPEVGHEAEGKPSLIEIVRPTAAELWASLESFLNSLHKGVCGEDSPEGLDHAQFVVMALRPMIAALLTRPEGEAKYRANFLWPHEPGSVEESGYEFANAMTEEYREQCWKILLHTVIETRTKEPSRG